MCDIRVTDVNNQLIYLDEKTVIERTLYSVIQAGRQENQP